MAKPARVHAGSGFGAKAGKTASRAANSQVGKVAVTARPVVRGFHVKGARVGPVRIGANDYTAALTKRKSRAPKGIRVKLTVGAGKHDLSIGATPHGGTGRNTQRDSMGRFA